MKTEIKQKMISSVEKWPVQILLRCFIVFSACEIALSNSEVIKIGFMYSGLGSLSWPGGFTGRLAAELAMEKIYDAQILPSGLEMELVYIDTLCDPKEGKRLMFPLLDADQIKAFVGPSCSTVASNVVAFVAHSFFVGSIYQKPFLTISYFYDAIDEDENNLIRRLSPKSYAPRYTVRVANFFGWHRFGVVYDVNFLTVITNLYGSVAEAMFFFDPSQSVEDIERGLMIFSDKKLTIFFTYIYEGYGKLLCAAERAGLMDSIHVWFAEDWLWGGIDAGLETECSEEQKTKLFQSDGVFSVSPNPQNIAGVPTGVGLADTDDFYRQVQSKVDSMNLTGSWSPSIWDVYSYDLVWMMAYNLNATIQNNSVEILDSLFNAVDGTEFYGISGLVGFDGIETLSPQMGLIQYKGFQEKIAIAQFSADTFDILQEIEWALGKTPLDYIPQKTYVYSREMKQIYLPLTISFASVAGLVTVLAGVIAAVNFKYREARIIKLTTIPLNYVILSGVCLLMISIVSMGTSGFTLNVDVTLVSCYVTTATLTLGFTLGFGALFVKTWRVNQIFLTKDTKQVKITDARLLFMVAGFVLVDVVTMSVWFTFFPFEVKTENSTLVESRIAELNYTQTQYQVQVCDAPDGEMYLRYSLMGIKLLMLGFGGILAMQTRNIHIEAMNDSKSIGVSIYNVVVCCIFGGVTNFALEDEPSRSFAINAAILIFCTAVPLAVIFGPRHLSVLVDPSKAEVAIRKTTSTANSTQNQSQTTGGK